MGCGTITIGSRADCETPLKAGTRSRLFLLNYDDLISTTASTSTPNLLTALTLATNTVSFLFEGYKQDVKPSQEIIAPSNGSNQFKHSVGFIVYEISQTQKNNLQKLAKGNFIAIVENKGKSVDAFEVYGLGSGMEIIPGVARDSYANGGGYIIQLATPDSEFEPKLPQTLFITDYATTLALVEEYAGLPTVTTLSDLALQVAGGDSLTVTGTNFYGNTASSVVLSAYWVNQVTGALVAQTGLTVASDTSITCTTVALTAGSYRLRVTTSRGVTDSTQVAIAS
jgi:hypothetical protein